MQKTNIWNSAIGKLKIRMQIQKLFDPHCAGALSSLSIFCWCYTCIHVSFSAHIWGRCGFFFSKQNFEVVFFSEYCSSIDLLYFVKKVFNRYPFISVSVSFVADSLVFQLFFLARTESAFTMAVHYRIHRMFQENNWLKLVVFSVCQSKT